MREKVLALCFCQGRARYHHWRIFAGGMSGVCIEFSKDRLLHNLDVRYEGLRHNEVTYKSYSDVKLDRPEVFDLPFVKRPSYSDEREYRVIRLYKEEEGNPTRDYDIDLSSIEGVVLSPWMPAELFKPVSEVLRSIPGCKDLVVARSHIVESGAWSRIGRDVLGNVERMWNSMPDFIREDMKEG